MSAFGIGCRSMIHNKIYAVATRIVLSLIILPTSGLFAFVGAYGFGNNNIAPPTHKTPYSAVLSQIGWVQELARCESGLRSDISVIDTNGLHSYGYLQFQLDTFYGFGKQYGILPEGLEKQEALNLIYDKEIQSAIALKMAEDGLVSSHWVNCYRIKNLSTFGIL